MKQCASIIPVRSPFNSHNRCNHSHIPVAINMKIALRDTSLPTGGGPSGQEPLAVLKGTPVGEFHPQETTPPSPQLTRSFTKSSPYGPSNDDPISSAPMPTSSAPQGGRPGSPNSGSSSHSTTACGRVWVRISGRNRSSISLRGLRRSLSS